MTEENEKKDWQKSLPALSTMLWVRCSRGK